MAGNKFLSLEEAAERLGIATEKLVEMRSSGNVRGFKDGNSWKFPEQEIDRLVDEGMESGSDIYTGFGQEDAAEGSAELVLEQGVDSGSQIMGDDSADENSSDLDIGGEPLSEGSEISLVASPSPDPSSTSEVTIVPSPKDSGSGSDQDLDLSLEIGSGDNSLAGGDDLDLGLSGESLSGGGESDFELELAGEDDDVPMTDIGANPPSSGTGSGDDVGPISGLDLELGSDPDLELSDQPAAASSGGDVLSELDLFAAGDGSDDGVLGDSSPLALGGDAASPLSSGSDFDDALGDDDDLLMSEGDSDDLVLGSAEDLLADSGFNLLGSADSGLSLESAPLNLSGSSVSALDLTDEQAQSPVSGTGSGGSGSGSLVDFQADEEFQLSPSGMGLEADDDSGSQVIDVEDSEALSEAMGLEDAGGWAAQDEAIADEAGVVADQMDDGIAVARKPLPVPAPVGPGYEVPYSLWNVITLAGILIMLSFGGMLMTDLARNLWRYSEPTGPLSSLTEAILKAFGLNG